MKTILGASVPIGKGIIALGDIFLMLHHCDCFVKMCAHMVSTDPRKATAAQGRFSGRKISHG
jgi:hypothetical protein